MFGIFAEYHYMGNVLHANQDGVIAAFDSRPEAEKFVEEKELARHVGFDENGQPVYGDGGGTRLEHGEWAAPSYKIVGVRETQKWLDWLADFKQASRTTEEKHRFCLV